MSLMNNVILFIAFILVCRIVTNEILKRGSRHGSKKEDENYFPTLQASINVGKRSISVGVLLSKLTSFVLYAVLFIVVVHVLVRLEQEHIIFNDPKYSNEKIMEVEREWIQQYLQWWHSL
jgi:large-conductance mechanosensitive channel